MRRAGCQGRRQPRAGENMGAREPRGHGKQKGAEIEVPIFAPSTGGSVRPSRQGGRRNAAYVVLLGCNLVPPHHMARSNGWGEIRTRETLSSPHAFQACALNHSATHPTTTTAGAAAQEVYPRRTARAIFADSCHDGRHCHHYPLSSRPCAGSPRASWPSDSAPSTPARPTSARSSERRQRRSPSLSGRPHPRQFPDLGGHCRHRKFAAIRALHPRRRAPEQQSILNDRQRREEPGKAARLGSQDR